MYINLMNLKMLKKLTVIKITLIKIIGLVEQQVQVVVVGPWAVEVDIHTHTVEGPNNLVDNLGIQSRILD